MVVGLRAEHLDNVVAIHRAALPDTLNARLGHKHLRDLYAALASEPSAFVRVAIHGGTPIGVVSAVEDPTRAQIALLARVGRRAAFRYGWQLARHPGLFVDWIRMNVTERPVTVNGTTVRACLTAIAVAAESRGLGAGRALVSAVESFFRARRHPYYRLDTRADNYGGRAFYKALGFFEADHRAGDVVLVKKLTMSESP